MNFSRLLIIPIISVAALLIGSVALPVALFWYEILPTIGFVFLATSWLIPLFWYKRVPKTARLLTQAKSEHKPPLIIAHDTGRASLTLITERLGEGIIETLAGKFKILPQFVPIKQTLGKGNPKEESIIYEKDYRDFITKRTILTGLNLPFFLGYSGKLCMLNPEALALYEAGEMQVETSEGKYAMLKPQVRGSKVQKTYVEMKNPASDKPRPLMLLDPRKIKDVISRQFDVTQIAAIITESEQIGRYGRPSLSRFIIPIGILGLVIGVGIILLVMGPGLLEGFGGGV